MKVWIARDHDGLWMFFDKPKVHDLSKIWVTEDIKNSDFISLVPDHPWGKDITFENSPQEIELVRK